MGDDNYCKKDKAKNIHIYIYISMCVFTFKSHIYIYIHIHSHIAQEVSALDGGPACVSHGATHSGHLYNFYLSTL